MPWITTSLKTSIKRKNHLYVKWIKHPTCRNEVEYKLYKNKLEHLIRISKRRYYHDKLEENKTNLKKTWKVLRDALNKRESKHGTISMLNYAGKMISEPSTIATTLNQYFTSIGEELSKSIPNVNETFSEYLGQPLPNSIYIEETTPDEVCKVVKSLKNSSPGWDEFLPEIVKENIEYIIDPLTHVMNLSLCNGYVPSQMKKSVVTPVHKSGDKSDVNNYRPISVLPFFSKVLEKLMYNRLLSFIEKHELLSNYQFGFRKAMSTELALAVAVNKITTAMDKGENCVGIFLDLRKAFDTVNHEILLAKLQHIGIRGLAHKWFTSYFKDRRQCVKLGNYVSEDLHISYGVPQGSLVGPLCFLLYLNDLPNVVTKFNATSIMFADDTSIFFTGPDVNSIVQATNNAMSDISNWLRANKLSLNVSKTKAILFSRKRNIDQIASIKINDRNIQWVDNTSFLGIIIDKNLSWKSHIDHVAIKMAKTIGIMNRVRNVLNKKTLLLLYQTLVGPHLSYCNAIWGNAPVSNLERLFLLQKRAVRIICGLGYLDHTTDQFANLGIFTVHQLNIYVRILFVYKWVTVQLPSVFSTYYQTTNSSQYNVRRSRPLVVPLCNTAHMQRSLRVHSAMIWNKFSTSELFTSERSSLFRVNLKNWILITSL